MRSSPLIPHPLTVLAACGNIVLVKDIQVRPARPQDKEGILTFCHDTFEWGDYIADVWDDWLADHAGVMLIATSNQRPIGLVHVALLADNVAWMEGMRIHPDYRRRGIGSLLDRAAREYARAHDSRIARLATSIDNVAAQGVLDREGYARVCQFNFWSASPTWEHPLRWRVATSDDVALVINFWRHAGTREATANMLPTSRWTWTNLTEARAREQIEKHQVRLVEDGFALIISNDEGESNALDLHALVGSDDALYALARDTRAEAGYRGYQTAQALIAEDTKLNSALEREGFGREGAILIYEQVL